MSICYANTEYCAFCVILREKGERNQAITHIAGIAVCEEHIGETSFAARVREEGSNPSEGKCR